jgi:hypothetical protein
VTQPAFVHRLVLQAAEDLLSVRPAEVAVEVAEQARLALAAYGDLAGEADGAPVDAVVTG